MLNEQEDFGSAGEETVFFPPAVSLSPSRRAVLIVLSGGEIGQQIELAAEEITLGRGPEADIQILAPSMSRLHARIVHQQDATQPGHYIVDLKSLNGTLVNNQPIGMSPLRHGDRIRMGDVLFRFLLEDHGDREFYDEVHRRIHFDALTGFLTMDSFRQRLDAEIRASESTPFTLGMTDLDGLKRVNDTHGHLAGRHTIRVMGEIIRQCLRPQDSAGLYGGDETILLLRGAQFTEAAPIAEAVRSGVANRVFEYKANVYRVTISVGLAEWPSHGETAEELIDAADRALYAAKAAGRNCVRMA